MVVGRAVTGGSTPRRIRTSDLRIRSPLLYPAELWARKWAFSPFQIIAQTLTQRNPSRDNLLIINDGI